MACDRRTFLKVDASHGATLAGGLIIREYGGGQPSPSVVGIVPENRF